MEAQNNFQIADRYTALGIPHPVLETICNGQCEGTGMVPCTQDDGDSIYRELWDLAHNKSHSLKQIIKTAWHYKDIKWLWQGFECDGWHFVRCPDCDGTGKRKEIG